MLKQARSIALAACAVFSGPALAQEKPLTHTLHAIVQANGAASIQIPAKNDADCLSKLKLLTFDATSTGICTDQAGTVTSAHACVSSSPYSSPERLPKCTARPIP